jgi:hypothetical protein
LYSEISEAPPMISFFPVQDAECGDSVQEDHEQYYANATLEVWMDGSRQDHGNSQKVERYNTSRYLYLVVLRK